MKTLLLFTILILSANFANAQWQILEGPIKPAESLLVSAGDLFAGCNSSSEFNGVYKSSDAAVSWVSVNNDGIDYSVPALAKSGATIFAAQGSAVYSSANSGTNWTNVSTGLPNAVIIALAENEGTLYAGNNGVYSSTNNGLTWTELSSGWNTLVFSLAAQGETIFAGLIHGMRRSTDSGVSWIDVNNGLPDSPVNAITFIGSTILAGTYQGVYSSTDMGDNWIATDLTGQVSSFTIVGSTIFAGSFSEGVFLSTNNGSNWTSISEGLSSTTVTAVAASDEYLFAAIYGMTVCRRPLSDFVNVGLTEQENSTNIKLFPNPSSDKIAILLNDVSPEIQFSVYNNLGQKLTSEIVRNANSIELNVSDFASGLYFLKVEIGADSFLEKFVVQ